MKLPTGIGPETDIGSLRQLAAPWAEEIRKAKRRVTPRDFEWYRYDTLSNLEHLDRLLTGSNRRLLELIGKRTLLDLGCGDGELSLFFAALGCRVLSMDYGPTNHNGMKGIRRLRDELQSGIEIRAVDFDSQFNLEGVDCGLALLLGVLYHLKNPLYMLEALSKHAKFCIMSTKTASVLPDGHTSIAEWPVGYLLSAGELNEDPSNFWVFSETGFKRLLDRTNWTILDWRKFSGSDERIFCLAQSTYGFANVSLLDGWYEPEKAGWRWTKRIFSVEFPAVSQTKTFKMEVYVPPESVRARPLSLTARAGSNHLFSIDFDQPGLRSITRNLALHSRQIDFELNGALPPDSGDSRERGIIVSHIRLE